MSRAYIWMVANPAEGRDEVIFVDEDVIVGIGDPQIEDAGEDTTEGRLIVDGRAVALEVDIGVDGTGVSGAGE